MIILTKCHKRNVTCYAGQLDDDPDKLRRIIYDVAIGLRIIHSHGIYHHNLKLENVLEKEDSTFCIADTGLSKLFTSQCPESLVFNGELACIPPEVFDESGRYACPGTGEEGMGRVGSIAPASTTEWGDSSGQRSRSITETRGIDSAIAKVDMWGFGIFMYRLAYGKDPFVIAQCTYEEACSKVMNAQLEFPTKPWPFAKDLEDAISWCVEKVPERRPTILRLLKHPLFHGVVPPPRTASSYSTTISSMVRPGSGASVSVANLTGSGAKTQASQYTFETRLGMGRWSETILVRPRYGTQEFQAFKIVRTPLQKRLEKYSNIADDIRRQLSVSRKITQDNIIGYLDIVDSKQGCFVVQEYMKNGCIPSVPSNLRVKDNNVTSLVLFLRDILTALTFLHTNGIAHLILMPSNIFYCQETNLYRVADFGPLFLTPEEIKEQYDNGTPIYALPEWITSKEKITGYEVDTFFVGLLTASCIPSVFTTVWNDVTHPKGKAPFDVEGFLRKVEEPERKISRKVIAFIRAALTTDTTPQKLFEMPLLESVHKKSELVVGRVVVTEEEVKNAVHVKPESRFETRMQDALGHDPLIVCNDAFSSEGDETSISLAAEKTIDFSFSGPQIVCGQCSAEVPIAFYLCPQCPKFVRCGKCAINHPHKETHELVPYLVYVVEAIRKDEKRASLVHPSSIKDVHSLETLEMCANIPVGSLTKYVNPTRSKLELTGRFGFGLGLGKTMTSVCDGSEWSSVYSANLKPFSSTSQNNHFGAQLQSVDGGLSPKSMNLGASFNAMQSSTTKGGLLSKFKTNGGGGGLGVNNGSVSVGLFKQTKKMALPKEWEVDIGLTWQQVVDSCRFEAAPDLNLHQLHLVEVPCEIYNPPLLHVVNLTLSQNSLVTLPHEISFLKNLRKLIVSYNELETLPDSLGNLLQLESLDASHNKLTMLPQNFVYLTNLELVVLDYNNFSEVPECLLDILSAPVGGPTLEEQRLSSSGDPRVVTDGADDDIANLSPALRVIYLVANNSITTFPDTKRLKRFADLSLSFDNEPSLYGYYMRHDLEQKLPNITMKWNKIYPDRIIPHLYCGALRSAQSQIVYNKLNISYLLTVGRDLTPTPPDGGKHRVIVVDDIPGADIFSSFQEAIEFIDESQRREQGCLVHCFAGLSRSATTVIAYLMAKKKMRMDEAYLVTKKGRPAILPNKSFLEQLIQLDKQLFPDDPRPLDLKSLGRQDV
ncbi:protein-tyrosine phosphatase [Strigomonas culicis]|uniref:protein-tyrosine-phosphatase n=1 Tax=Strigomonas culicis TaxID=28005 RepID=S9TXH6_9TRYP|nr:protein-tyrosine phosphatase [Strigomonas culicis]|eukprot:EPY21304.1 protein-tyrosine phosphatase [Strigomonas culicis]